jgi:hypothetical protein
MLYLRRKKGKDICLGPTFGTLSAFGDMARMTGKGGDKEYPDLFLIPQLNEEPISEKQFEQIRGQSMKFLDSHVVGGRVRQVLERLVGRTRGEGFQVPLDAVHASGYGFEIKATTTNVTEYRVKLKAHEVSEKVKYAKEHGLRPAMMIVIMDSETKTAWAYWREGIGNSRLTRRAWHFMGKLKMGRAGPNANGDTTSSVLVDSLRMRKGGNTMPLSSRVGALKRRAAKKRLIVDKSLEKRASKDVLSRKRGHKRRKAERQPRSQTAYRYEGPKPGPGEYDIWRSEKMVGMVIDRGGGGVEVQGDDELKSTVKDILSKPATVMVGGFDGKVFWDGAKTYNPGDPRHVRAAITGGSLVKYGYIGDERVKEEKEKC